MKTIDRVIVELSKAAVFETKPNLPHHIDWQAIYNKSLEQNISGLLFSALEKFKIDIFDDNLYQKWQKNMIQTVLVSTKRNHELYKILKELEKNNVQVICLKGIIVKELYPIPELRTMGDFDVLIKNKNIDLVSKVFFINEYMINKDPFCLVAVKEIKHWEIFTTVGEEFKKNTDYYDALFFNNTIHYKNMITVNHTLFCMHLIAHMAKHYLSSGIGLRALIDIALFISNYKDNIDFEVVKQGCLVQGYEGVYEYTINAVHEFFNVDIKGIEVKEKESEKFVDYMLINGVLGKTDNAIVHQISKSEDDNIGFLRKTFFPSVALLKFRYKYLVKYPILLPIAWIQRFFSAIFNWNYSIKKMCIDMKDANEFSKKRLQLLKDLGLIKK